MLAINLQKCRLNKITKDSYKWINVRKAGGFKWGSARVCSGSSAVNMFIKDLDAGVESLLIKWAGDMKHGRTVNTLEVGAKKKILNRLETWAQDKGKKFSADK